MIAIIIIIFVIAMVIEGLVSIVGFYLECKSIFVDVIYYYSDSFTRKPIHKIQFSFSKDI